MLPNEVSNVLKNLQALFPGALFLVGGSTERGDMNEDSDVDLYCVAPILKLFLYKKKIKNILMHANNFHCMLVSEGAFSRGWYYIEGVDINGRKHRSPLNKFTVIRNSLLFAIYHSIIAKRNLSEVAKAKALKKANQQIAVLRRFKAVNYTSVSFAKADIEPYTVELAQDTLESTLKELLQEFAPLLTFTWASFWLYNVHFLKQGKVLNLRLNPVILVVQCLYKSLNQTTISERDITKIKTIVFPVYII